MMVEVPCARMRPSRESSFASVEMIWRPWDTTRPSARTRPVSSVIGRERFPLVSMVA